MDEDFLLSTETAKELFESCAKNLPIIDYHCHLSPKEIWEDAKYENVGQLFLKGDHYKWKIMRACGIAEDYVTGGKSDYEKFEAFASVLHLAIGNQLAAFRRAQPPVQRVNALGVALGKDYRDNMPLVVRDHPRRRAQLHQLVILALHG